jgi:porphobilinogen synthase
MTTELDSRCKPETTRVSRAVRMRRLRAHPQLRALVRETGLTVTDLVMPLFIKAGRPDLQEPITTMPGQFQWGVDSVVAKAQEIHAAGIPAVLLFGVPEYKDGLGSAAYMEQGVMQMTLRALKASVPDLLLIVDLCCCQYTDHGHCGVLEEPMTSMVVDNDCTLTVLSKQAVSLARAGADVMAPSGMMDGMVGAVRTALDAAGFASLPLLSYAVKYASAFYGPFREAAQGAPQFSDRRSYQMDAANGREALREVAQDLVEGADMLMVKPAHTYLDVIYRIKTQYPAIPLAAYHVSGEYAMLKAASASGWIDEKQAVLEVSLAMKRAGANMLISYFSLALAGWL